MIDRLKVWVVATLILVGCGVPEEEAIPRWYGAEMARIGSLDDPSTSFYRISDIDRDEAGRLYVADAGSSIIRVYERNGDHVRDMGKPGPGPGEFEHLDRLVVLNDTIYARHKRGFGALLFDTAGVLLETITASPQSIGSGMFAQLPAWQFSDGTGVAGAAGESTVEPRPIPLFRTDRFGLILDTLLYIVPRGSVVIASDQRRVFLRDPIARPPGTPAFSRDGKMALLTVYPSEGLAPGEFRLEVGSVGSPVDWERVYSTSPVRYSSAKVDSLIESAVRSVPRLVTEAELRSVIQIPTYEYPALDVRFDEEGRLWVQLNLTGGVMAEWLVLNDGGIPYRRVQLPLLARPRIMTGDTVFVLEHDDFDVQYVVEYLLVEEDPDGP